MKKTLLFLLAFLPICLFAENVSLEQARKIAEDFLQRRLSRASSVSLRMVYDGETPNSRTTGTPPALYVFDNTHQPGFVIVAGDDAAYPVLGYSFESDFPEGPLPANIESWLQGMKEQINALRSHGAASFSADSRAGSEGDVVVQLGTPKWSQDAPYNGETPIINGKHAYTGCTITAVAIAMRYLKWPDVRTKVIPAYETYTNKLNVPD